MRVLNVKGNTEVENDTSGKWKGCIIASIAAPLHKTWQIGSDFSGLHKFVPIVEVCERVKGSNRMPGCLRFYTMNSATGLPGGKRKAWARERLLNINEETHSYTYGLEGSNMNLENCEVSFNASDGKDGTTIVKWAWEVDPVKKSTREKTLNDMSEFGCTFIKGLEGAAATDPIDFELEEMTRSLTLPMPFTWLVEDLKSESQHAFDYEFKAATSSIARTYYFESVDFANFKANAESDHSFLDFDKKFESTLCSGRPSTNQFSFEGLPLINPEFGDDLIKLEAEVFGPL